MFSKDTQSEPQSHTEVSELLKNYEAYLSELNHDKNVIVDTYLVLIAESTPGKLDQYRHDFNIKHKEFEGKIQTLHKEYSRFYATDTEAMDLIDSFQKEIKNALKTALRAQLKVGHESISDLELRTSKLTEPDQGKNSLAFYQLFDSNKPQYGVL